MADQVQYIMDKLVPVFKLAKDVSIFSEVSFTISS